MTFISILIPIRNERDFIISCLQSIDKQNNKEKIEVLIMDDASSDGSFDIVKEFSKNKNYIHLFKLEETERMDLIGKARVLYLLGEKARGDWLITIDADMELPENWLKEFSKHLLPVFSIVNGCTYVCEDTLWGKLQSLEWIFTLTVNFFLGHLGIPIIGLGNHMAIKKDIYKKIGGFEKVYSITEDYILFQRIIKRKVKYKNLLDKKILARTKAEKKISSFIAQRRRWMNELNQTPVWLKFIMLFYATFIFLLILTFFSSSFLFYFLLALRCGLELCIFSFALFRIKKMYLLFFYPFYFPYTVIVHCMMFIFYFSKKKIVWKDRAY